MFQMDSAVSKSASNGNGALHNIYIYLLVAFRYIYTGIIGSIKEHIYCCIGSKEVHMYWLMEGAHVLAQCARIKG